LGDYYSVLVQIVADDILLGDLQNSLLPHGDVLPFPDANRALLNATSSELQKRADLAKTLQELSSAFSGLTGSTASTDISNAASKLGTELISLKALPPTAGAPISIPSAIGDAGKLVASLIQQHEEKKAAAALDATLNGLKELVSQESDVYDSLNQTYLTKAASLGNYCIDKNLVDVASVLAPALQPFSLTARLPSDANSLPLKAAAKTRVDETTKVLVAAHQKASAAMLQALTEMSTRIHELATSGRMPSRGTPVTLKTVESWISSAKTYFSSAATNTSSSPVSNAPSAATPKKSKE
jgi:ribosomal protein S12 methylthiotransferase accessory factor YcaO